MLRRQDITFAVPSIPYARTQDGSTCTTTTSRGTLSTGPRRASVPSRSACTESMPTPIGRCRRRSRPNSCRTTGRIWLSPTGSPTMLLSCGFRQRRAATSTYTSIRRLTRRSTPSSTASCRGFTERGQRFLTCPRPGVIPYPRELWQRRM